MSNKQNVKRLLRRCEAVVKGEKSLLRNLAKPPATPPQSERCKKTARRIHNGPLPKVTQHLRDLAAVDDDRVRPCPPAHKEFVRLVEESLGFRKTITIDKLETPQMFSKALLMSERNAIEAADCSKRILKDTC